MYLTLLENCGNFDLVIEMKNLFYFKLSEGLVLLNYNIDFPIIDYYKLSGYFKPINFWGSLIPLYSTDFTNFSNISILSNNSFKLAYPGINILSNNSFKLAYPGINIFIPFHYVFVPRLYDYFWYICIIIYKLFNNPIVKLLLAGILYYIIEFIIILYNIIRSKLGLYLVFFSRFAMVSAYPMIRDATINNRNKLLILFTLGNLFFLSINVFFDYFSFRITDRNLFNNIMLGLLFLFNIIAGVFASNGTYYYNNTNYNGPLYTVISLVATVLFSSLWFFMSIPPANLNYIIINNVFRAVLEVLTFNSASWLTYDLWYLWLRINNANYIALIFLPLYLLVGTILIYIEISGGRNRGPLYFLAYGILYTLMFTFIAFFTNSVFNFYSMYPGPDFVRILIVILTAMLTTILFPDIYRERRRITINVENNNYNIPTWRRAFILCLHYLLLFTAFVFLTGILYPYIMSR